MLEVCPECRRPVDPSADDSVWAARPLQAEWVGDTEYVEGLGAYLHVDCLRGSTRPWRPERSPARRELSAAAAG